MRLTAQIKLLPSRQQTMLLRSTLERANTVCTELSQYAWCNKTFRQYDLHHAQYQHIRATHNLSSQLIVRCIAKVADAYKNDRDTQRTFRPHGAIAYDSRILTFDTDTQSVSIWTIDGRQRMGYISGKQQLQMLEHQRGESRLVYRNGEFFLLVACEVDTPAVEVPSDVLGIDLGIVNLATTSDGMVMSGEAIEQSRQWYASRRTALQSHGTRSARRRLRKLSGKQKRFQRHTNHVLSKTVVALAEGTGRAIALEDLTGIRRRETVTKSQRTRRSNWGFHQLRAFITYKAERSGVPVILVDPRDTSRTCHACGHCEKANRRTQSAFLCRRCGHDDHADVNAALNIRARGVVNLPMVSTGYAR